MMSLMTAHIPLVHSSCPFSASPLFLSFSSPELAGLLASRKLHKYGMSLLLEKPTPTEIPLTAPPTLCLLSHLSLGMLSDLTAP
jgi:hypothetical protein